MVRSLSTILLAVIGISTFLFPVMEGTHQLMHELGSQWHSHESMEDDHHHHTLADHHLNQHSDQDPEDQMMDEFTANNYIALSLGAPAVNAMTLTGPFGETLHHSTMFVCVYSSILHCPPTPPPLG